SEEHTSELQSLRHLVCRLLLEKKNPNLTPGAMGFRVYHLKHHSHQGDYEWDADLANHWEARLVGNSWYRKAIWLMLSPFFQITRPPRLRAITMWDRWFSVILAAAVLY